MNASNNRITPELAYCSVVIDIDYFAVIKVNVQMKTALITGATSGIGKATAENLIKDHRLILCGRREDRLKIIDEELSITNEVHTLTFDVRDEGSVFEGIQSLPEAWKKIDILVNNAGNAHGLSTFDEGITEDYDAMMDINVKGLIYVTKAVLPALKQSVHAHIVNVSSIAGKETYAKGNVYCASKAAVEALSQGMRIDLAPFGIKVTNIAPGAVETEFSLVRFKGDREKANKVYQGFQPLTGVDVADTIAYCLRQPEHVQITDLTVFPKAQYSATGITREGE